MKAADPAPAKNEAKEESTETIAISTTKHVKIWFSNKESEWMPLVNQLRLIRHREKNPEHTIHLIGCERLLNGSARAQQREFCRQHKIHYLDIDTDIPRLITELPAEKREKNLQLLRLAQDQLRRCEGELQDFPGNLAAASDALRWAVLMLGIYSDLDVEIDFRNIPKEIKGYDILLPCIERKEMSEADPQVTILNNNFIAIAQDSPLVERIRDEIIATSEKMAEFVKAGDDKHWVPMLYGPNTVTRAIYSYLGKQAITDEDRISGAAIVFDKEKYAEVQQHVLKMTVQRNPILQSCDLASYCMDVGDLSWVPETDPLAWLKELGDELGVPVEIISDDSKVIPKSLKERDQELIDSGRTIFSFWKKHSKVPVEHKSEEPPPPIKSPKPRGTSGD